MIDQDTLQGLLQASRQALKVDKERADAFQSLMTTPGWAFLVEMLNLRVQMFSELLLQPLESMDRAGVQEFLKGAMWAFVLARDIPSVTIQSLGKETEDVDESTSE